MKFLMRIRDPLQATEFNITNGPFSLGILHKPQKVVAGVDRVAVDGYCCTLWSLQGQRYFRH